jgi:predicted nucleic acid-binding Zn ribbon protein
MKCIVCEKPIPEGQHVCSPECEQQWHEREAEARERERQEDHNAGCWSYEW